jgi:DNA repair protein RadD
MDANDHIYQGLIGRELTDDHGLGMNEVILDYTGVPHDIFSPQIYERRPSADSIPVKVACPKCNHEDDIIVKGLESFFV